jgi:general secretion pathway protein I
MKTNAHRAARGFTLIEVLVALLILSVALAGIAVTMGRMLSNAQLMQDRTYASWIAQNRIVQIRAEGPLPGPGRESGDVEFANGTWDWRAGISDTGIENLLRVDVSVSRAGSDDTIKTVTGFIGVPAMPNGANRLWAAAAQGGTGGPQGPGGPGAPATPGTTPDAGDDDDGSHQ